MKKTVFLLVLCMLLWGCGKKETPPDHRVVTGVQVEYHQGEKVLHRRYHKTKLVRIQGNTVEGSIIILVLLSKKWYNKLKILYRRCICYD